MNNKLKEYRDKSYEIKMKIALEVDSEKKKQLIEEEKAFLKEYCKFLFDLKNKESMGGKNK